jgi:hypothetical protein
MYKIVGIAIAAVLTATLIAGAIAAPQDAFAGGHHKRHHHHHDDGGGNCNGGSICQSNEQSIEQHSTTGSNTATQTASNQACIDSSGANACRSQ